MFAAAAKGAVLAGVLFACLNTSYCPNHIGTVLDAYCHDQWSPRIENAPASNDGVQCQLRRPPPPDNHPFEELSGRTKLTRMIRAFDVSQQHVAVRGAARTTQMTRHDRLRLILFERVESACYV
jgi:hypothetical protein